MKDTRLERGHAAEAEVAEHLLRTGTWRLLERNYRCRAGEVDLILEEILPSGGIELVFVEVRTRRKGAVADSASTVDGSKRRRIEASARWYLAQYRGAARGVRFDVFARNGRAWVHFREAWYSDS